MPFPDPVGLPARFVVYRRDLAKMSKVRLGQKRNSKTAVCYLSTEVVSCKIPLVAIVFLMLRVETEGNTRTNGSQYEILRYMDCAEATHDSDVVVNSFC